MLDFLKISCTSGLIDALIVYISQESFAGFTVSISSGIAVALWELFTAVKKLDDWDFCVYMQATTHFREHSEFTMEELKSWLPGEENPNRSVVPSEILKKEQKHSHERVLPSRGISYPILTKVLSEFGFSPRLYNLFSLRNP